MAEDLVTNPHTPAYVQEVSAAADDEQSPRTFRVIRIPFVDPDQIVDSMVQTIGTRLVEVDAKLVVPQGRGSRVVHCRSLREVMALPTVRRRILERFSARDLREINERAWSLVEADDRLRAAQARGLARVKREGKLQEVSAFQLGMYSDEVASAGSGYKALFPIQDTILPSTGSPQSKQQLFMDYLEMHRRSWEAATRNPIGKRICDIVGQFVLGRGVVGTTRHQQGQMAWDGFWKSNRMRWRLRTILRELLIYGEVFLRYFRRPDGLSIRSLDPSTIWDIVTNVDDIEDVQYYHQQYSILNTSPIPLPVGSAPPGTLIIRQIPAGEIDHFKINCTSSEKRGRSQLYCILGWLLRFKEFANDRVLLNKMRSMFALDVAVDGGATEVSNAESQFATPPNAGAVLIHNKAVEIDFKNANNNANEAKTDAEMILKIIAVGAGVSEQFLGVSSASTRAGALISTEPDVKNFETFQEIVEDILEAGWVRVKRLSGVRVNTDMEFTFPALAQEDRSVKLKDIAFAESMDYFSKERSAGMAAKEFGVTTYDFAAEQRRIKVEAAGDPVVSASMQQVAKVAPDPAELAGAEPGLGSDLAPGAEEEPEVPAGFTPAPEGAEAAPARKVVQTSGQMGFSAKRLSGRNLANTKATLNRPGFERGREKIKIAKHRSEGTPLKASGAPRPRHVWSDTARAKALAVRRQNALRRQQEP